MQDDRLLVVLRVSKDKRVRCQSPNCKKTVYQQIHVVRIKGAITIYGSECFKRDFEGQAIYSALPVYSTVTGKKLSDDERALLDSNTELLLQRLAQEHDANIATETQLRKERECAAQKWTQPMRSAHSIEDAKTKHSPLRADFMVQDESQLPSDPRVVALIQAKREGKTRDQILVENGIGIGHPDFYDYSLLLAKAGFRL